MRTLALAAFLALAASAPAAADEVTVKIENFTFNPAELTVKPGTTVTWSNDDDIPTRWWRRTTPSTPLRSTRARNTP